MKRVVTIFVMIAMLISMVALFSSCSKGYYYDNGERYTAGGAHISQEVSKIDINWVAGNVRVEPYDGDEIIFKEDTTSELDTKKQLHYFLDGTTLYIKFAQSGIMDKSFSDKSLIVLIPKDEVYNISIETESANVYLYSNESNFNEVYAKSKNGFIDLKMNSARSIYAENSNNNVELSIYDYVSSCNVKAYGNILVNASKNTDFVAKTNASSSNLNCSFDTKNINGELSYTNGVGTNSSRYELNTDSGKVSIFPLI